MEDSLVCLPESVYLAKWMSMSQFTAVRYELKSGYGPMASPGCLYRSPFAVHVDIGHGTQWHEHILLVVVSIQLGLRDLSINGGTRLQIELFL